MVRSVAHMGAMICKKNNRHILDNVISPASFLLGIADYLDIV